MQEGTRRGTQGTGERGDSDRRTLAKGDTNGRGAGKQEGLAGKKRVEGKESRRYIHTLAS